MVKKLVVICIFVTMALSLLPVLSFFLALFTVLKNPDTKDSIIAMRTVFSGVFTILYLPAVAGAPFALLYRKLLEPGMKRRNAVFIVTLPYIPITGWFLFLTFGMHIPVLLLGPWFLPYLIVYFIILMAVLYGIYFRRDA